MSKRLSEYSQDVIQAWVNKFLEIAPPMEQFEWRIDPYTDTLLLSGYVNGQLRRVSVSSPLEDLDEDGITWLVGGRT